MGPRLGVDVYEHGARRWTRHRWTLASLIAAIDRCRPRRRRDAAWTFCVTRDGGDEDQAIAALLHDAVEDQGGKARLADIRARFGERVARIVEACSDTDQVPKPP